MITLVKWLFILVSLPVSILILIWDIAQGQAKSFATMLFYRELADMINNLRGPKK